MGQSRNRSFLYIIIQGELRFCQRLFVCYFKTPSVFNILNKQGGEQLVNKPVYTDSNYSLGSYEELNGSDKPDYQYAISAWVFVDAAPPSTSSSYNQFTSLLNFANKPKSYSVASKDSVIGSIISSEA